MSMNSEIHCLEKIGQYFLIGTNQIDVHFSVFLHRKLLKIVFRSILLQIHSASRKGAHRINTKYPIYSRIQEGFLLLKRLHDY